jgi:hypothetical protein
VQNHVLTNIYTLHTEDIELKYKICAGRECAKHCSGSGKGHMVTNRLKGRQSYMINTVEFKANF